MPHPTKALATVGLALAVLGVGCNKAPAEEALRVVDETLEAAKPTLSAYAPDELAALTAAAAEARALLDGGRYTDALRAAQALPARIEAAAASAASRREELTAEWNALAGTLGPAIEGLAARMAELAGLETPPRGWDADALAAARNELDTIASRWARASEAWKAGDAAAALAAAEELEGAVEALQRRAGLAPAPAAAAAAR
jgi:hypothetical protein